MTTKKEEKFSKKRQKEMDKCFGKGEHLFALKKGDPGYKKIKGVKTFLINPADVEKFDESVNKAMKPYLDAQRKFREAPRRYPPPRF